MENYFVTSIKRSFIFLAMMAVFFLFVIKFYSRQVRDHVNLPKNINDSGVMIYSGLKQKSSDWYFKAGPRQHELKFNSADPMIPAYSACMQIPGIARLRHTSPEILLRIVNDQVVIEHHGSFETELVNVDNLNLTLDSLYPVYNAK